MIPSLAHGNTSLSVGCPGSCVDFYVFGEQISGDQKSPHVYLFFLEGAEV